MKKSLFLSVYLLVSLFPVLSQSINVKAGDDIAKAFSPNGFYRYPQFMDGTFIMKDGQKVRARVNYNLLFDEMQYIGDKGDTMALNMPERITGIIIGSNQFIYDKGYSEIVSDHDSLKLAKKIRIKLDTEKKGGYGESAPSASIDNYRNIVTASGVYSLQMNQDVVIRKNTSFFWLDQHNNLLPATKKNIAKLVTSTGKAPVEGYISQNNIDFSNEQSLVQLLEYALPYIQPGK